MSRLLTSVFSCRLDYKRAHYNCGIMFYILSVIQIIVSYKLEVNDAGRLLSRCLGGEEGGGKVSG